MKILVVAGLMAMLAACSKAPLSIDDARIRETLPGRDMTVAYFKLANSSENHCVLKSVQSPLAGAIEVHRHLHKDGRMQMRKVDPFSVQPQQQVVFEPGGYHLMVMALKRSLGVGEQIEFQFDFGDCGRYRSPFPVVSVGR
jgi:periplasmic copper chaperone A